MCSYNSYVTGGNGLNSIPPRCPQGRLGVHTKGSCTDNFSHQIAFSDRLSEGLAVEGSCTDSWMARSKFLEGPFADGQWRNHARVPKKVPVGVCDETSRCVEPPKELKRWKHALTANTLWSDPNVRKLQSQTESAKTVIRHRAGTFMDPHAAVNALPVKCLRFILDAVPHVQAI